jgi:HSP20 family protein
MNDLTTKTSERFLSLAPAGLMRLNPFSLMRRMSEEMDRVAGEFGFSRGAGNGLVWAPAIEVSQRDGAFVARAELPGLTPDQVKVEIAGDEVVIQGERVEEREADRNRVHLTERQYGRFYRAIPLPDGAKANDAKATFENGVLEIAVPFEAKQTNRTTVPIQTGSTESAKSADKAA